MEVPEDALPTGFAALDEALGGGWPLGQLVELRGRGRSSLALSAVRQAQARALPAAWIDGPGQFCPATAGIDLAALRLVAPGPPRRRALLAADLLLASRAYALVVLDLSLGSTPLASWFRLARQATRARTWLLVLGEARAGSASALAVHTALVPVALPAWGEAPSPGLRVEILRRRGSATAPLTLSWPA